MSFTKNFRQFFITGCLLIFTWVLLTQCFILKERWTDKKAYRIFEAKNVPLQMHDTIVNNRHLHYAITGDACLPTLVFIHGSPGSLMH